MSDSHVKTPLGSAVGVSFLVLRTVATVLLKFKRIVKVRRSKLSVVWYQHFFIFLFIKLVLQISHLLSKKGNSSNTPQGHLNMAN